MSMVDSFVGLRSILRHHALRRAVPTPTPVLGRVAQTAQGQGEAQEAAPRRPPFLLSIRTPIGRATGSVRRREVESHHHHLYTRRNHILCRDMRFQSTCAVIPEQMPMQH